VLILLPSRHDEAALAPDAATPEVSFQPAASDPVAAASAASPAIAAALVAATASAAAAPAAIAAPAMVTGSVSPSVMSTATASAARPAAAASAPAAAAVAAATVPVPAAGPAPTGIVVFKARAESWVQVTDAKGAVSLRKLLAPGESAAASGALPLAVTVGSVSGTEVQVRGKPFDLAPLARDNVARFEVK
jgi:cytoskeleton protein RodZ